MVHVGPKPPRLSSTLPPTEHHDPSDGRFGAKQTDFYLSYGVVAVRAETLDTIATSSRVGSVQRMSFCLGSHLLPSANCPSAF